MFPPGGRLRELLKDPHGQDEGISSQARRGIQQAGNQRDGVSGYIDSGDGASWRGARRVQWERQAGADDPATLDARMRLALAYRERGRDEAAAAELEQVAARREETLGSGTRTCWRPGTSSRSATFT